MKSVFFYPELKWPQLGSSLITPDLPSVSVYFINHLFTLESLNSVLIPIMNDLTGLSGYLSRTKNKKTHSLNILSDRKLRK